MLFNIFNGSGKEPEVKVKELPTKIDSKVVQEDIDQKIATVMKELDILPSKNSKIEELQNKIKDYKSENFHIIEKAEKLRKFGFIQTPSIKKQLKEIEDKEKSIKVEITKLEEKINEIQKREDLRKEYLLKYPGFKFVDDDVMLEIKKKYQIYEGQTCFYGKEIPDRVLDNVEIFGDAIKASETTIAIVERRQTSSYWGTSYYYNIENNYERQIYDPSVDNPDYDWALNSRRMLSVIKIFDFSDLRIIAPASHFVIPTIPMKIENRESFKYGYFSNDDVEVPCAKFSDNNMSVVLTVDKLNEHAKKYMDIDDPIACLKVHGGYIIIDAWDKEAEIPEIKNEVWN